MDILEEIGKLAKENGYNLTEYAPRIAKVKLRLFGTDWKRCPCDPNSDRSCISKKCREDIEQTGRCHCNCFTKEQQ